jgi:hypothetical protein
MADIALISCTKSKRGDTSAAALLYTSALFNKSLLYAQTHANRTYILSAKHGLLNLGDAIDPYELAIKSLNSIQKEEWAQRVGLRLHQVIGPKDKVHLLAGRDYSAPLLEHFKKIRCVVANPLSGLSLGNRIGWLRKSNRESELGHHLKDFYSSLKRLYVGQGGGRLFSECSGKSGWPTRGVYLIFEPEEFLREKKFKPLLHRVIRVGTHAVSAGSKATLWNRLSAHRGTTSGGGSHRSSIFRLHVGAALMARSPDEWVVPTWGIGQVAPKETQEKERRLEEEVSKVIGRMRVLWRDVPDQASPESDRAYLEKNAIGLLSRSYLLAGHRPTTWLGHFSPNVSIPLGGLWNLNHLNVIPSPEFSEVFSTYVDATLGKIPLPTGSLAPVAWYRTKNRIDSSQLTLF